MIVPEPCWRYVDIDPLGAGYHSGSIGGEVECKPDSTPSDPSWMLLP